MTTTSTTPTADTGEIRRGLDLLHPGDDDVCELRVLNIPGRGKPYTASGYFSDKDAATRAAAEYDAKGPAGVYVILNPVDPALLSRAPNRMIDYPVATTTDAEIIRRRWVFIDVDAKRPSGIPATSDEMEAALLLAHDLEAQLRNHGFPETHQVNSGNGAYLLYPIDLPNDQATHDLLKGFYGGLATLAVSPNAEVDDAVHNAARIIRLPGTTNRKAFSTADRPHRVARLLPAPETAPWLVTAEQLEAVAKLAPQTKASQSSTHKGNGSHHSGRRIDVPRYLADHGVEFTTKTDDDRTFYMLAHCPFDANHGGRGETAIVQSATGLTTFDCKHNSCQGRRWQDVVAVLGPLQDHHFDPPRERRERYDRSEYNGQDQGEPKRQPIPAPVAMPEMIRTYPTLRTAVIAGLLRQGETMNIIAPAKIGKSWLVHGLALTVATGGEWLDYFPCDTGRVLLIDGELHPEVLAHRVQTVARAMGIDDLDGIDVLALRGMGVDLPGLGRYLDHIEPGRYALIVLDALYRFLPPGTSENDNAAVMALYNLIDGYARRLGAGWVNIHHSTKGSQSEKAVVDVGAGAGSQARAADTHLILRPHEEDGVAVLDAVARSWPPIEPQAIRFAFPLWTPAPDADPTRLESATKRLRRDSVESDQRELVAAALKAGQTTKTKLRSLLGWGGDRFGRAFTPLEANGTFESTVGFGENGQRRVLWKLRQDEEP